MLPLPAHRATAIGAGKDLPRTEDMMAIQGRSLCRVGFLTRSTLSGGKRIGFCVMVMVLDVVGPDAKGVFAVRSPARSCRRQTKILAPDWPAREEQRWSVL